jgi:hypothetical protein
MFIVGEQAKKTINTAGATSPVLPLTGHWVRSNHEWHGDQLCPTGDGTAIYDPLADTGTNDRKPLWQKLLDLDLKDREAVRNFYCSHGPLGILRHHVIEARYQPVRVTSDPDWYEPYDAVAYPGEDTGESPPLITIERSDFQRHRACPTGSERGRILMGGQRSGVLLWQDMGCNWIERDLDGVYPHFFPLLDGKVHRFPPLYSYRFWVFYSENYDDIVRAVSDFRMFVKPLGDMSLIHSSYYLNRAHPMLIKPPEGVQTSWSFPSLLSVAAIELLNDISNSELRLCRNAKCGKYFKPSRKDRKYCSEACGNVVRVREYQKTHPRPKRKTE